MPVPLESIVKQLAESGIIAPGKLENFVPPKASPKDGEELLRELFKQNLLTKFQAQQVAQGRAKSLVLGEYTLIDKIGAGGMGQVFKAVHRRMDRLVAIKMLPQAMLKDAAAVARFEREVRAAAKLSHPNIVAAHDAGQAGSVHFLVMEYVEGSDLSALVKKNGPLPVAKAVNYISQAARGLEFAHKKGVIHRDVKPANLLLGNEGTVRILDMGLARIESTGDAKPQAELTGTGAVMGTVDYMAPEQALGTRHADARADIYSLGCTLYFLLSGKAVYDGDTLMAKLVAHREHPIPSLQDVHAAMPQSVQAIFEKTVAKKVDDRYQTMSEVVVALDALGFGGSASHLPNEAAAAFNLSDEDRKKLSTKGIKKTSVPMVEAVVSHKTTYLVAKIVAGLFATIIAPIMVIYIQKYLEKADTPPTPTVVSAPAASSSTVADPGASQSFQQWQQGVASLPADQQVTAVKKKLRELNPGFDGNGTASVEGGVVTNFAFSTEIVTDISALRALAGLKNLNCGANNSPTALSDISPLEGMKLTNLNIGGTQVSDLTPLKGLSLTSLIFAGTQVSDLTPLSGMNLTYLICYATKVSDLSPLRGMPLTTLLLSQTQVADLSPLEECKSLTLLNVKSTKVTPASVAALQKAIPNCKIEWDGNKPSTLAPAPADTK